MISRVDEAHAEHIDDIFAKLEVLPGEGLNQQEVSNRRSKIGFNEIVTPKPSVWKLYISPLLDVLITVYLIMTFIMVVLSIFVDNLFSKILFWIVMISFNMILAIFQQYRAQKKIEALSDLSPPIAIVIRNGQVSQIEARELIPGDIIELALGDRIPADARIIESSNLTVNEASLTGESVAVRKVSDGSGPIPVNAPIAKHENMLYLGTFIQTGSARAVVTKTGNSTELGKIASEMSEIQDVEIPLRKRVNSLGKGLAILMVSFLVILITFTAIRRTQEGAPFTFDQFAFDVSQAIITAMAVMPINIPLLVTATLITGVLNMATRRVVIKNLSAVETLGRTSVLCSDKTGTISQGKMTVKLLWDTEKYYQVWPQEDFSNKIVEITSEDILDKVGKNDNNGKEIKRIKKETALETLLTCSILNNDANLSPIKDDKGNTEYKIVGNFTDGALLVLAMTNGLQIDQIKTRYHKLKSYPFDSLLKRMSGMFKDNEEDDYMVFSKGATEVILPRCTRIGSENNTKSLTQVKKEEILNLVSSFANQGYRVLSMAYKEVEKKFGENIDNERELAEENLVYIGFSIIYDPPRPGVYKAVADLDSAGIFPIMITGDAPSTAGTIAKQVGILDEDEIVVHGSEASNLPDEDFFKVSVFARVAPKDKEIIVRRYQDRGDVVTMTGDGVNDALAITRADAGVAMGISGTEVAKEAADVIITDDSYVSLVDGVSEGRNLYERIRIMIFFYISVNLAEAIMYFSSSFRLDFFLLNDWQRVYIFSICHAIPVLAIIFGPDDKRIMELKPRANDALLPRRLINLLALFAITTGLIYLLTYFIFYSNLQFVNNINTKGIASYITFRTPNSTGISVLNAEGYNQAKARTMLLTVVYLVETLFVFSVFRVNRKVTETLQEDVNSFVLIMIFSPIIFHFILMYILPFQLALFQVGIAFEIIPLSIIDLIIAFGLALIPLGVLEGYKYYIREIQKLQF